MRPHRTYHLASLAAATGALLLIAVTNTGAGSGTLSKPHFNSKGELVRQGDGEVKDGQLYLFFVLGLRRAGAEWVMARVKEAQSRTNRNWYRDLRLLQVRDRSNFAQDAQGGSEELRDANETFL